MSPPPLYLKRASKSLSLFLPDFGRGKNGGWKRKRSFSLLPSPPFRTRTPLSFLFSPECSISASERLSWVPPPASIDEPGSLASFLSSFFLPPIDTAKDPTGTCTLGTVCRQAGSLSQYCSSCPLRYTLFLPFQGRSKGEKRGALCTVCLCSALEDKTLNYLADFQN